MKKIDKKTEGIICLVGSSLAFSLMSVCVKQLNGRIPIPEMVFARASFSLICTRLMIRQNRINPWGINKKLLVYRGLLGSLALFCIFKAITELPIAIATIIQYTYPTITAITASILLRENMSKNLIYSLLLGWIGIILVIQPELLKAPVLSLSVFPFIIAITGAVMTSFAYICIKLLSQNEHNLVIIHYFPLISIPITLPFLLINFVMPEGIQWVWLIGIGFFTQIGQVWLTNGIKRIPVGKACSYNYFQVLFAAFWGLIFFKEKISYSVVIGGLCVVISSIISVNGSRKGSNCQLSNL